MNILILSNSNPYKIASIAAYDLFKGLKKEGYKTKLIVRECDKYEKDIVCIDRLFIIYLKKIIKKLKKIFLHHKIIKSSNDHAFQNFDYFELIYSAKTILKLSGFKPDIIYVIFAQHLINFKTLFELQQITNAPIIWQLPDMAPFTGGCHFSWTCDGYKNNCGNCPALFSNSELDLSRKIMNNKLKYINKLNIHPVIGSDWLLDRVKQSAIFSEKRIKKIFLPVDYTIFYPISDNEKEKILTNFKIPSQKTNIMIASNDLKSKRKGVRIIGDAFMILNKLMKLDNINLIVIGKGFDDIKNNFPKEISYNDFGLVERDILPSIYRMSNFFISASLEDVGPYTITESLLCGIPVVSFNTGFANDFVIDNKTGYLVERTTLALAQGIKRMIELDKSSYHKMKNYAYKRTKKILNKERIFKYHIELINEVYKK